MTDNAQTFQASSMPEALAVVKRELGPDAVILGTRSIAAPGIGRLTGRRRVEITAAAAEMATVAPRITPARTPAAAACPQHLVPYYTKLIENEVAEGLAGRLVRRAAGAAREAHTSCPSALRQIMRDFVAETIPTSGGIKLHAGKTRVAVLVGPAGSGKTTTLAKLAAHFGLRERKRVAVLSLDMHRMATHEQLRRYADIIGIEMHAAQSPDEARKARAAFAGVDLLLIDTPGIGPRDHARFGQLQALLDAVRPDEVHLVLPASLSAASQARIAETFAEQRVSRVVLTRLDEAIGLGVILNTMDRLAWRLSYVTDGQSVPNDIEEACSRRVAELLLGFKDAAGK